MTSKTTNKFSPEVRERAVRIVDEHRADYGSEWAALTSIAGKIGCTAETLRRWCREEASRRAGPAAQTASEKDRLKLLKREVKELRRDARRHRGAHHDGRISASCLVFGSLRGSARSRRWAAGLPGLSRPRR